MVESTGSVVTPYSRYPNLLETLLGFLKTEQQSTIRSQTLRLLGLLGALDPYKYKQNTGQIDSATVQLAPLIPVTDNSEMELSYEMSPSGMCVCHELPRNGASVFDGITCFRNAGQHRDWELPG